MNALFVNSGLLGQRTFAQFVEDTFVAQPVGVTATQIVLTDGLTPFDRVIRRAVCQRLWPAQAPVRNLDLFRYRAEWHSGLLARRRIRRLERAGARFDVLHFHHQATAYASLARMRRTPSIVSIDCTQRCLCDACTRPIEAATYGPGLARDGDIFRAARLVVAPSEWAAASVRDEYPDCRTEIAVMPMPVDLARFDPGWIEARYRRALDPAYRPRVLFLGGDFVRKGGEDLLAAWRAGRFGDRADLDLATGAPIDTARLPEGVSIHPNVRVYTDAWVDLWRSADVFVLPTREEAFGIVFLEAAAAGLPAIGTRIMAIPELVEHERTGLLVPPREVAALVEALHRVLESAAWRRDLGVRARARAEGRVNREGYRDWLVETMQRLARPSQAGVCAH